MKLLPDHELLEVLKASTKDRANLLIGISVDFDHKYVILYRCDATPLEVPFTWFTEDGDSPILAELKSLIMVKQLNSVILKFEVLR